MEDSSQLFAVCHVNDVIKRRAVGFVLARRDAEGKTVPSQSSSAGSPAKGLRLREPLPPSGLAVRF